MGTNLQVRLFTFVRSNRIDLIFTSFFVGLYVPKEGELNADFRLVLAKLLLVHFAEQKCSKVNTDEARLEARIFCHPRHLRVDSDKVLLVFAFILGRSSDRSDCCRFRLPPLSLGPNCDHVGGVRFVWPGKNSGEEGEQAPRAGEVCG